MRAGKRVLLAVPAREWLEPSRGAVVMAAMLVVFLVGGSSGAWVQSQALLVSASALLLGYAICGLGAAEMLRHLWLLRFALACLALVAWQLVPLPGAIGHGLPGHALVAQIEAATGLGAVGRPISLVPFTTSAAFFGLLLPAAMLLLGLRVDAGASRRLLLLVIAIGLASGIWGLVQLGSPAGGPAYFYRVTNPGATVGFFANRNHQALLLAMLLPMMAAAMAFLRPRSLPPQLRAGLFLGLCAVVLALVLLAGSRAGLLSAGIGLGGAGLLYYRSHSGSQSARAPIGLRVLLAGVALTLTGMAMVALSRATALDRLLANWLGLRQLFPSLSTGRTGGLARSGEPRPCP